jgi:PAS domain S-box-containing protein
MPQQNIQAMIDSIPVALMILDDKGDIRFINKAFASLTGWAEDDVYEHPAADILSTIENREQLESLFRAGNIALKTTPYPTTKIVHKAGQFIEVRLVSNNAYLLYKSHSVIALLENHWNEEFEFQLKKLKHEAEQLELTQIAAKRHITHELLTPINGISGMVQLLKLTSLDIEQSEYLDCMSNSLQELTEVVRLLSNYTEGDEQRIKLYPKPLNLKSLCAITISEYNTRATARNLSICLNYCLQCPLHLVGDPDRISQALGILLGNAIKFSKDGEIQVLVHCTSHDDNLFNMRIEVKDHGIGIPTGMTQRVYEPFFQVDSALSRRYNGLGLGLTILRQLVQLMEGSYGVESIELQGSTFWFELNLPASSLLPPPAVFNPH